MALVWIIFGFANFGLFLFSSREVFMFLAIGILLLLMAVPEALPEEYTREAGILRLICVLLAVTVVPYVLVSVDIGFALETGRGLDALF
ncbi:hypothetical protein SAMN04489842_1971 [Natronobacterium texcoconense]|uniref:Uncharacterized protein n=2 Tax=Natronobacterium texcoconense TaxID=1095778 RepID=A0A1H1FHR9_NATTX|nr:hypothetical protein SAMN04489842_1971 [Natronobacterium texcoconense]